MQNLVDITQGLINRIDLNINIINVTGIRLFVCRTTLHLTIDKIVVINSLNYRVTAFDINNWIEVIPEGHSTPIPINTTIVTAPSITFLHGTPQSTNNEYLQLSLNSADKTPFIWLLEGYSYEDLPIDSSLDKSFTGKLFFLDWANEQLWLNTDHNNYVIKPMENLKDEFIRVINSDTNFKRVQAVKTIVRPRFGVTIKDKGSSKKIIDEDLSGVEHDLKLEVYDTNMCLC